MSNTTIRVFGTRGINFIDLTDPEERSTVARHWNAIRDFLERGDDSGLARFTGVRVGVGTFQYLPGFVWPPGVELETDLDAIEREAFRGDTGFESIYES